MNACKYACISASISLVLLASIPFANSASGGVINFVGTIVDGGCTIDNSKRAIDIGCYNDASGQVVHTSASINASQVKFPQGRAEKIKWLNANHTLGIMNVVYD